MLVPRKWAPIPLLASCLYMPIAQGLELGPVSLPGYRIVLAVGLVRVILRRENLVGGINTIDKLILAWGIWMVFASFFHEKIPGAGPVYALGFVLNVALVYFLTRVWCSDLSALSNVFRMVAWLLVPVALSMVAEHVFQKNFFGILAGTTEGVYFRSGQIRAQGPFAHPILAGTVGAVSFPLMVAIWRQYRISATVGMIASIAMVLASTSSGPLMSLVMGAGAMILWLYRPWLRAVRWTFVGLYVVADIVMSRPAYYLISKIDLTGSSTGWHRSRLIQVAIEKFSTWWLFGTDYTGNWMGQTVDEAGRSADITNYYIWIGTIGGFPAMLLLIAVMWCAFIWVGRSVKHAERSANGNPFMIWCLGAGLFAHAVTSVSVSYTDQSMMFFWLNVGAISSMYAVAKSQHEAGPERPSKSRVTPRKGKRVVRTRPGQGVVRRPSPRAALSSGS